MRGFCAGFHVGVDLFHAPATFFLFSEFSTSLPLSGKPQVHSLTLSYRLMRPAARGREGGIRPRREDLGEEEKEEEAEKKGKG